jgi:predicted Zn-dependent protease
MAQDDALWHAVDQVGSQAVELLTADECPEMATTLVLAPDQMMLQIHESIGHPLELDRILGDERNYAGGSFVKPEDFGKLQYGSDVMNVTFDPTNTSQFASYGFDDTGAVAEKQFLIRNGRLERGLGSHESQTRLGIPGVACARVTSWNRPPIDRMANINLEPGDTPVEEIIAGIEDGVYMEANRSWSIDDQRYKFQFGCEYAKRIRHGELAETLRNPNYRATTPEFWKSLVKVGNRQSWKAFGTPYCGKGEPNQVIRVGHGAPVCAFESIEVFGGAG